MAAMQSLIFKNCLSTNTMGMKVSVLIQEYTQMWEDLDTWRKESQKCH